MTLNVLPMPPVASTTAGASKNTNRPVSRKYPNAPAMRPSPAPPSLIRRMTVVSAKTLIIASGSPNSTASACCIATTFCCRLRIISRPVRSPTWASRGYSCPPKFRWLILPSLVRSKTAPQASSSQNPVRCLLGVQFGHPPVVQELAAAHRVAVVDLPVVVRVHVAHGRRAAALGHDRVRLAEQGLGDDRGLLAVQPRLDRRAQPGAARADDHHVVRITVDFAHTTARSVN